MHHVSAVATTLAGGEMLDLRIDPALFEDFLWMKLFEKTLSAADRGLLRRMEFFATRLGHENARSLSLLPPLFQRRLDTSGWDVFFAATVSPYRLSPGTSMMIRYYDALPLLSPHTIGEPWPHANSHAVMLHRNMEQGAHFYCDSEPVREDLLALFPEAERRVHTIPALIAPEYRPDVRPSSELKGLLRRRASPDSAGAGRRDPPGAELPRLFMAVSTLEPRKNYLLLFRAFELARRMTAEPIQLLIVANPGWRSAAELKELKLLVAEGAYHVAGVPIAELRIMYSMAHCVIAPSRAEGFDLSGVEGMACGAPLVASDIPVHRWVYGEAAEYFDPYDENALAAIIAGLASLPRESGKLADMRDRGLRQSALYTADALSHRWSDAIHKARRNQARSPHDKAA
jgi:glycosyltransferase involved in cell wall biosynthesis